MIPAGWDDGFSYEITPSITVRPMLGPRRKQWAAYQKYRAGAGDKKGKEAGISVLFKAPNYFGPAREELPPDIVGRIAQTITGYSAENEKGDFQRLEAGFVLAHEHPHFARLSCETCKALLVDSTTGKVLPGPQPRPVTMPILCECPGMTCPKVHHAKPIVFDELCAKVWRHYWESKASGQTFSCPIIQRNWALIEWIVNYGRAVQLDPFLSRAD